MQKIIADYGATISGTVLLAFGLCLVLVLLKHRIPRLMGRPADIKAVQSAHNRLTPRVGGIAIFGAFALTLAYLAPLDVPYIGILAAAFFLFAVGLAEDLGFDVSPRKRIAAAGVASLVAIMLLGQWLLRTDIPFLDPLLAFWPVGVALTLLLTVGIANGFNLIDGVNGLAALAGVVAAVSLAKIASKVGYMPISYLSLVLAASLIGFLLLNYPFGLIFLGDAGAYTIGFVLSWFGIALLAVAPEVSPWAVLLLFFWPVADTLLAIYRRVRRKGDAMAPDRLHVHQMVMRALEICWIGRKRRHISNPLTTLVLAPFVIAPPLVGVLMWDDSFRAFLSVIAFCTLFATSYTLAGAFIRRFRRQMGLGR
ncbi:MraY family glycosyltransferase [Yoonia litorea]|uniref:UDP-N-acetylmuramyl pentapeptide phosphotransferase/UDP-N-acetylglucosamine-1-phosphate transferase n=1 Tax=Yoonia litorea TaxID=1123755 RepID=A0A1I6MXH3_9RHOB|nr:glycosyltransferase [Yoonia litorea]SFS20321.1 UDP-N-acetylmuramyl pentapeptide phosphotransferase/UDP-N-acetylglucosamine-1-phosphate transferase [Yoonia litorea]